MKKTILAGLFVSIFALSSMTTPTQIAFAEEYNIGQTANERVQWGFFAHGFDYAHAAGYKGDGVKIAVIDSGYYPSDDLDIKFANHDGTAIFNTKTTDDINSSMALKYHGSSVSKVIVAKKNDYGVLGNVPNAEITFYLLDTYKGNLAMKEALLNAINDGNHIINVSMSASYETANRSKALESFNYYFNDVVSLAKSKNVAIVFGAGNEGEGYSNYYSAYNDYFFGVGAVDEDLDLASFSSRDKIGDIDFVGAGQNIITMIDETQKFQYINGTSYAVPQIVSMLAILKQINPSTNVDEMRETLKAISIDLGDSGLDVKYGYGFPTFNNFNFKTKQPQKGTFSKDENIEQIYHKYKKAGSNIKKINLKLNSSQSFTLTLDNSHLFYNKIYQLKNLSSNNTIVTVTEVNKKAQAVEFKFLKPLQKGDYLLVANTGSKENSLAIFITVE